MIFRFITAVGAALSPLAMSFAAQAADLGQRPYYKAIPRAAHAAAIYNWTGLYVGGHIGYGLSSASGLYDQADAAGPTDLSGLKLNGLVAGGQLGFNWQISNFVVGVEADASYATVKRTIDSPEPAPRGPDPITAERENLASIRARLGFAFDRALIYGTGGYGWTKHSLTITEAFDGSTGSVSVSKGGMVYGGGVEYALVNNLTVRLEYLHYAVGTTVTLDPAVFSDADPGDSIKFGNIDVVRLGVNYRF
jgi:outer membrane immunogenic protein